jgi:hypothetical protein
MLLFCFPLKLEVLKPLYYFMLKIKEIVFLLGENIWKWRLQSHIDESLLLNLMSL